MAQRRVHVSSGLSNPNRHQAWKVETRAATAATNGPPAREMKTVSLGASRPSTVKFRMPTRDNLVPIRVDVEVDGQRYRDAFTWNPRDPDSEIISFAKRTAKDLKLQASFVPQMLQSIQGQLAEFRSYEGQEMQIREKILPLKIDLRVNNTVVRDQFLWDIGNLESDPEEFARTLCDDLNITDPEVGGPEIEQERGCRREKREKTR